jgi:hypothetical protein
MSQKAKISDLLSYYLLFKGILTPHSLELLMMFAAIVSVCKDVYPIFHMGN